MKKIIKKSINFKNLLHILDPKLVSIVIALLNEYNYMPP